MTILRAVLREIAGMFWADAALTGAILALVGVAAVLAKALDAASAAGVLLIAGSLAILLVTVARGARR